MDVHATRVIDYLLAQSWQIALLAAIVGIASFGLRNRSAHVRYLLWLIVLAKCLLPPYVTIPIAVLPEKPPANPMPPLVIREVPIYREAPTYRAAATVPDGPAEPSVAITTSKPKARVPSLGQVLVLVWLAGVLAFLLWIGARALRYTVWLRRHRTPLPPAIQREFQALLAGFKFTKPPNIWLTQDISQPFVWGFLRGSVYLPGDFARLESPRYHRTIVAHELSHVARFDPAVNVLQVAAQAIYWFHPFVWWMNRRIRQEREKCCDEMAIAQLDALPEQYSGAIVEALAAERRSTRPIPSLAIVGSIRDIEERIRTMMTPGKQFYRHPSLVAAAATVLLALLIVPTAFVLTARAETEAPKPQSEQTPIFQLMEAAEQGDIEQLKSLIAAGADVNARDSARALYYAAGHGHLEAVRLLLVEGADVNPEMDRTPLHRAIAERHLEVAKLLIAHKADVNTSMRNGRTPLHDAVRSGDKQAMELLLSNGAEVNGDDRGYPPLLDAIWAKSEETVKALIAHGADVNRTGRGYWSPLINAIWEDHPGIVKALIEAGADLNVKDSYGWTPLCRAVEYYAVEVVRLLLDAGAEISEIHRAVVDGDLDRVKGFIESGTEVDMLDAVGRPLSHWAFYLGQMEIFDYLMDQGADITIGCIYHHTPLHFAAERGLTEVVKQLIDKGADVNAKTNDGRSPLWLAIRWGGHEEVSRLLIAAGADVNATLNDGRQLLGTAIWYGHEGIAKLLLASGADVNLSVNDRAHPVSTAAEAGRLSLVELLIAHGADVNARTRLRTPLHAAVRAADSVDNETVAQIVKRLLEHGADVNATSNNGVTPLHLAASWGRAEAAKLLLAAGADVNAKDNWGFTPLSVVRGRHDRREVAELLRRHGGVE
jgi:ankyrin repeat protein/beta-lactamase regulating signal transducer with metallopeptidase domain